jgi:hypothetical protein
MRRLMLSFWLVLSDKRALLNNHFSTCGLDSSFCIHCFLGAGMRHNTQKHFLVHELVYLFSGHKRGKYP